MVLEASSTDDFFEVLAPAYESLLVDSVPSTLEAALKPGDYDGSRLTLCDWREQGHVSLHLHAADSRRPPIFLNAGVTLTARDVRLEGIVFKHTAVESPVLSIQVSGEAQVEGCAFLHLWGRSWPQGGALVEIKASAGGGKTAHVRDCWFLGNRPRSPSTSLLNLASLPGHKFEQIIFENTVFVDNALACAVVPGATDSLVFKRCFIQSTRSAPVFVGVSYLGTAVAIEDSIVLGARLDDLIYFSSVPSLAPPLYQVVRFNRARLYLEQAPLKDEQFEFIDSTVTLLPSVLEASAFMDTLIAEAESGSPPNLGVLDNLFGLKG